MEKPIPPSYHAGMTIHLHIDPFSGIAGDMFLGAAIDLGVPVEAIEQALAPLQVSPAYRITTRRIQRHGIGAVDLRVELIDPHVNSESHQHSHHHHHHHTHYRDIMNMIDRMDTTERAKDRARLIVTRLAEAEARVHGVPIEKVHFHEVGAVDSIVDMLGTAVALEELNVETLSCGVLPISRGFVKCDHGLMPVPAPATAYLLQGLATEGVDRQGELITPTGAAIVKALCCRFGAPPAMTLRAVGYGAGDREDPKVPNLLRLMLGDVSTVSKLTPTAEPPEPIES
ncbi:MAG: hypothetical protein Kow00105_04190 [Phycisphaeraceae bacterium]